MFNKIYLPDGTVAESVQDVDAYLLKSGCAPAGDFSGDYLKNRRFFIEKAQEANLLSAFINNYKKEIWK